MISSIHSYIIPSFFQRNPTSRMSKKTLIKIAFFAPAIFLVSKEIFNRTSVIYNVWKNGKIKQIDCQLDKTIDFFEDAAKSDQATDLYCYAKKLINTNDDENIIKSRDLLKKAYDKGLNIAESALCKPEIFPDSKINDNLDSQFLDICCPIPNHLFSCCLSPRCPWDNPEFKIVRNKKNSIHILEDMFYKLILIKQRYFN